MPENMGHDLSTKCTEPLKLCIGNCHRGRHRDISSCEIETFSQRGHLIGGADMRVKVTLACTECKQRNYNTKKNKKNDPDRLEMNKYCKFCKKHTLHKETK